MSPAASQLILWGIVAGCIGAGLLLERRRARRFEQLRGRTQTARDAEGEALPPVAQFEDFAVRYPLPGRCRATAGGNRCRHDADTGDLCDIHWTMALQGYPTNRIDRDGAA